MGEATSIVTETISSGFPNLLMWFWSALGNPLLSIVFASARSFEAPQVLGRLFCQSL
jgi:hypothetical protein